MSWPKVKIDDITEVVTKGTTPTTYGMPFTDEGINFVKAEALNGDSALDHRGFTFVSEETHAKLARSILKKEDVLVTIAGANVGRCGFVQERDLPANTNQAVGIVRVDPEKAEPRFVYYYFKHPLMRAKCMNIGGQAAQPNVNLANLKGFEVPLPERVTQKRIASVLSAYDDLIVNNQRRIELLEEVARLLYREWFVHFRFPGHEHVKITDGVPEAWSRTTLGQVAKTNPESHKKDKLPEVLNYIDISSVSRGKIDYKTEMPSTDAPGRARRIAQHGDTIWSNVRPNLRAYSIVQNPAKNDVFSTGFTVLRAEKVKPYFLYFFVTSDGFVDHLINHATGTSYPAVRPEDFEKAEIIVPTTELQDSFEDFCEPLFRQMAVIASQAKECAKARDILLPRLMDGRLEI